MADIDGYTPLHSAAQKDQVEVMKKLLDKLKTPEERKAYLYMAANNGENPLYIASQKDNKKDHIKVIKELCKKLKKSKKRNVARQKRRRLAR